MSADAKTGSSDFVLFALTGMGNSVVRALHRTGRKPALIVTRQEPGSYPHYPLEPLTAVAEELGIPVAFNEAGERLVAAINPAIVLVATYHRILPHVLLDRAQWAVNLHPSLLPKYRGPNPFYWVIRNGESETGVTAHLLNAKLDAGPILWSQSVALTGDETQGSLRRRLAEVAADGAVAVMTAFETGIVHQIPQDESAASSFSFPPEADRQIEDLASLDEVRARIRSLTPYPGALIAGRRIEAILRSIPAARPAEQFSVTLDGDRCTLHLTDADLALALKEGSP